MARLRTALFRCHEKFFWPSWAHSVRPSVPSAPPSAPTTAALTTLSAASFGAMAKSGSGGGGAEVAGGGVRRSGEAPRPLPDADITGRFFQLLRSSRRPFSEGLAITAANASELRAQIFESLAKIEASHLGLEPGDCRGLVESGIGSVSIYEGPELSLFVLLLRQGACIPMHDHPGMSVCGRLLFGRLHSLALDPAPTSVAGRSCRATLHADVVLEGNSTFLLGPDRGNLHELRALEDSAFLDVIWPPYDNDRLCTHYAYTPLGGDLYDLRPTNALCPMTELAYCGPAFSFDDTGNLA